MSSAAAFSRAQPLYAEHGIATFPLTATKVPEVSNYNRMGLRASTQIASRFVDSPALGFMCGRRNGVTVLDVDTPDENVLADALGRHGPTPLIARTASGKYHAYYRHNGERRRIRPWRGLAIDVLGARGFVVAPPSRVAGGEYSFIQGAIEDLNRLPVMQGAPVAGVPREWASMREGDGRNDALFRDLARAVRHVDDFDQLLDCARTQNEQFGEPMADTEVIKVAVSVWKMQCEGRNRFGQFGSYVALDLVTRLATTTPDALALLNVLKAHNGPNSIFPIANAMTGTAIALGWRRLANARKVIVGLELVEQVSPQTQHKPALYRWPQLKRGECGE